jgi:hypothetical protein
MKSDLPVPALVLGVLPIIITLAVLAVSLVFAPKSQDISSSAAPIIASPTPLPAINTGHSSEVASVDSSDGGTAIACSSLYSPVCGTDGKTYLNQCEAEKLNVEVATRKECAGVLPTPTTPDKIEVPAEM